MAGGFELALFCDLIWAAEGTMLGLPETRLGIVPLAGVVELIAARAGLGRARALALGGDLYGAEDLAAWGAIDPARSPPMICTRLRRSSPAGSPMGRPSPSRSSRTSPCAYTTDGIAGADALLLDAAVGLFDTADASGGIQSLLDSGPGKTTFAGR